MMNKIEVPRELFDCMISALDDEGRHSLAAEAAHILCAPEAPRQNETLDVSAERNAMQRQRDSALSELKRECDNIDAALRILGLDPDVFRTDGGSLNLSKLRSFIAPLSPDHSGGAGKVVVTDEELQSLADEAFRKWEKTGNPVSGVNGYMAAKAGFREGAAWATCAELSFDKVKELNQ